MEEKEELLLLLEEIKDKNVIVEGRRDKAALIDLGFRHVTVLNNSKGFYEISEKFIGKEVLILSDFDSEGEEIAKKLSEVLVKVGAKVDRIDRKKLRRLFIKNKINTVEALKKLF